MDIDQLQQMKESLEDERRRMEAAYQRLSGRIDMLDIIIREENSVEPEEMPAEETGEG